MIIFVVTVLGGGGYRKKTPNKRFCISYRYTVFVEGVQWMPHLQQGAPPDHTFSRSSGHFRPSAAFPAPND